MNIGAVGNSTDIDDRNHTIRQVVEENGFEFREYQVTT